MTKHRAFEVSLMIATAGAWAVFLDLDSLWGACLRSAVEEGKRVYGEMYGPLSLFRPAAMWTAAALSVGSITLLGFVRRPIQPLQHNAGSGPCSDDSPASGTPASPGPRG